jgi:hypothetical protein
MAETGTSAPAAVAPSGALRLVLFGMPAAGKTSLLGALAQSAQTQEHLLHGRLADPSHGLAELQHLLYDATPRRTAEEVVPYTVDFEPFPDETPALPHHLGAVLVDCDGRVANDLLMRRRSLPEDSPDGTLASKVVDADTLILVVDASAPPGQVDADFAEFGRFLRLLERTRGQRAEVGGLPVFLVLTKCDLLAQPSDTVAGWVDRIEERKRQVSGRFQEFLARRGEDDGLQPFGRIELHPWATAIKQPALTGVPEKPREPYGVAELFRQALERAEDFRQRRRRSSRRLLWTVGGAVGLVAGMAALTVALLSVPRDNAPNALSRKLDTYRAAEAQTAAERLGGSMAQLERSIGVLTELRDDPEFANLSAHDQQEINEWLDEKKTYLAYWQRLQRSRKPAVARSEQELRQIEDALKAPAPDGLALPHDAWSQTPAGRLLAGLLEDVKALRTALDDVERWYQARKREGDKLWTFSERQPGAEASVNWPAWQSAAQSFLAATAKPRYAETARIPGAASEDVTFQSIYRFDVIEEARSDLDRIRKRLEAVRDLSAALGLGGPAGRALLVIPPRFIAADAASRLQELKKAYPNFERDFVLSGLPDAVRGDIRQAARTSYEPLTDAGRDVVLRRLQEASPAGPETLKLWRDLRPWLADPPELARWRVLARQLVRLFDPDRPELDPVADLANFLTRDRFDFRLKGLSLEIPDSYRIRPDGELKVHQRQADGQSMIWTYEVVGKERDTQRGVTAYSLRPSDSAALFYRPGAELYAVLPMRDNDNREWQLTWARSRSQVYQFERLIRPPRLHRRDQDNIKGEIANGVAILPAPPGAIPPVPDLVPIVKFDR